MSVASSSRSTAAEPSLCSSTADKRSTSARPCPDGIGMLTLRSLRPEGALDARPRAAGRIRDTDPERDPDAGGVVPVVLLEEDPGVEARLRELPTGRGAETLRERSDVVARVGVAEGLARRVEEILPVDEDHRALDRRFGRAHGSGQKITPPGPFGVSGGEQVSLYNTGLGRHVKLQSGAITPL